MGIEIKSVELNLESSKLSLFWLRIRMACMVLFNKRAIVMTLKMDKDFNVTEQNMKFIHVHEQVAVDAFYDAGSELQRLINASQDIDDQLKDLL